MYASVAFSDYLTFQSGSKEWKGKPFHPITWSVLHKSNGPNSLDSCLGAGLKRPTESNHSFVFFFFFFDFNGWKWTWFVDGAFSTLVFSYSHAAAMKTRETMSFQSSSSKVSFLSSFDKREARHIVCDFLVLVGYYEGYARKPNLTFLLWVPYCPG